MLSDADNERLTRVGPGTPMGRLFRRYWLPALLAEELPERDGAPVRVRLLGEDLVAFRDSAGEVGLVSAYCPHRRAPMFFGRNEDCGLRCVYHGWKFDRNGSCVDMPSEPPDSLFKTKVTIEAYPAWEGGGLIWAYLGPPELQPEPPGHELVRTTPQHRYVSKSLEDCNFLQALEGGIDPTHATIMHNGNIGDRTFLNDYDKLVAELNLDRTDYGFTYTGVRPRGTHTWVRGYHWIMPSFHMRARAEGNFGRQKDRDEIPTIDGHIWIPIDDTQTWVYNFGYSHDPAQPLSREQAHVIETRLGRGDYLDANYVSRLNRSNDYGIDRRRQKTQSMTGIEGINTQDFALQEGMGTVVDRSKEHLGTTDRAIITLRQILLESLDTLERGGALRAIDPASYRNVRSIDRMVDDSLDWRLATKADFVAKFYATPLLAVAIGDPSGVGTEITVKALATGEPQRRSRVMLIGNHDGIVETARIAGLDLQFQRVADPAQARGLAAPAIPVFDDGTVTLGDYTVGRPSAAGGRATAGWIARSVEWAEAGAIDGFIIGPVDNSSFKLAGYAKSPPGMNPANSYLLRMSGKLRFIPLGEHVMMRDVPPMVTTAKVLEVITLIGTTLQGWGVERPRIAVAGLNPHAAGSEDAEEIAPAVAAAQAAGLDVKGPLSPDTVFRRALHGEFDVVVAMYHDQGQIAIKTTGLEEACAIFIGPPYVRVGTPHGSALDIAGQNKAQFGTMLTALNAAASLAAGLGLS